MDPYLAQSDTSTDLTPSPISTGPNTQPLNSPASGAMSVASIVSPTHYAFSQHPVYESGSHSVTNGDSRRESVDSRLGANFGDMRLANSPYASANPSTTSLQSTLAQQRNPGSAHPDRNSGPFRLSNGYQPNYQRLPDTPMSSRVAPLITGPALGAIARAPEPTKGQAWAFPEEEVQRIPPAVRPSEDVGSRHGTSFYDDSRRNSFADSVASSQYTTESRLPVGQRRLEEGIPSSEYQRASSEFQVSTHHHSLQHRQISDLQNEDGSPTSSQPYSRTPELRVSHKLAERKRRLEMKDLFDTLRTLQSVERGAKASKWEILSKGKQFSINIGIGINHFQQFPSMSARVSSLKIRRNKSSAWKADCKGLNMTSTCLVVIATMSESRTPNFGLRWLVFRPHRPIPTTVLPQLSIMATVTPCKLSSSNNFPRYEAFPDQRS